MSYNGDLDRITEAEVVPDFVERLSLGRDLNNTYNTKSSININDYGFRKGTKLVDVLSIISIGALPYKVLEALYIRDVYITQARIKANESDGTNSSTEFNMVVADSTINFSSMTLLHGVMNTLDMDLTPICKVTKNTNAFIISIITDTPIPAGTILTFYIG